MALIRGTQLLGHTVRMGGQSGKVWLRWVSVIWFITLGIMLCVRLDEIHISHLKGHFQAVWYKITFNKNAKVLLINREATMKKRELYKTYMEWIS